MSALQRTPCIELHRELGARLVPFAGFELPVQYGSILEEHAAVRERAGLFDVSHMGQIHLRGPGALESAERLVTCHVASLRPGRVRYGLLCNEEGGTVDDVTVYRVGEEDLFLCVNAANIAKDLGWIETHVSAGTDIEDRSAVTGLLALQGPASPEILARLTPLAVRAIGRFRFVEGELAGVPARISRTGYTGADGFEIYLPAERTAEIFRALLEAGRPLGLTPAGLGARDTLRLEAALPLYGHELDDKTSPLEAGLARFVKLEEGGFLGAEALARQQASGVHRQLVGFVVEGRGIAREGYPLVAGGEPVGAVTSGAPSPTLGKSIGLGYVPPALAALGTRFEVEIRARRVGARVVETPFVPPPSRGPG